MSKPNPSIDTAPVRGTALLAMIDSVCDEVDALRALLSDIEPHLASAHNCSSCANLWERVWEAIPR